MRRAHGAVCVPWQQAELPGDGQHAHVCFDVVGLGAAMHETRSTGNAPTGGGNRADNALFGILPGYSRRRASDAF